MAGSGPADGGARGDARLPADGVERVREAEVFVSQVPLQGFHWLPLRNAHLLAVAKLGTEDHHRDPFDRLLVCQSRTEPMLLLSVDQQLRRYGSTVTIVA